MNEVNKTLFIPLYGKSYVSKKGIIIKDPDAETIWEQEAFPIKGKSKSKWLAYNMAMRARVFDDWTDEMIRDNKDALVLHIGCGLDSRCRRVKEKSRLWIDCDFPDVLEIRKKHYPETDDYKMMTLDASDADQINALPDSDKAIVVLEGISMYLTKEQVNSFFKALKNKYSSIHILMDVYTEFGAKASKYKNPINDVGVTTVYGIDNIEDVLTGTNIKLKKEHSITPDRLVDELKGFEKAFFKLMFTGSMYRKIYRLYELMIIG